MMDGAQSLHDLPTQQLLDAIQSDAYGASIAPIFLSSSSGSSRASSCGNDPSSHAKEDGSVDGEGMHRRSVASPSTTNTTKSTTTTSGGVVCTPEEQLLIGPTPAATTAVDRTGPIVSGATDLRRTVACNATKRLRDADAGPPTTPSPSPRLGSQHAASTAPAVQQPQRTAKRVTVVSPAAATGGDGVPTTATRAEPFHRLADDIRLSQIGGPSFVDSDEDDVGESGCRRPSGPSSPSSLCYDVHVNSIKYYLKFREAQVPVPDLPFAALTTLRAVDAFARHTHALLGS